MKQVDGQRLHLSMFIDDPSSLTLTREGLDQVKAAVLYADDVELFSPGAQMTAFLQDLLDAPNPTLRNLTAGLELDHPTLLRHGPAGPWAVKRILGQQIPGLATQRPMEASRSLDAYKKRLVASQEEADSLRQWVALSLALASGRVQLRNCVSTEPDLPGMAPNPYQVDQFSWLIKALRTPNTAVLCDRDAARRMREDFHLQPSRASEGRAATAAIGTGIIAKLPTFPEAPMDEVLGLSDEFAPALHKYRVAAAALRERARSGPFDADFVETLEDIWRTRVAPSISEIEDEFKNSSWVRQISKRRETVGLAVFGSLAPAMVIGISPHLAFLAQDLMNQVSSYFATAVTSSSMVSNAKVLVAAREEGRQSREALAKHDFFYLHQINDRL